MIEAATTIRNCIVSRVEEALWMMNMEPPVTHQRPYWDVKQWTEQFVSGDVEELTRDTVFFAVCEVTNAASDGYEPEHDIVWGGNIVRATPRTGFRLLRTGGQL